MGKISEKVLDTKYDTIYNTGRRDNDVEVGQTIRENLFSEP